MTFARKFIRDFWGSGEPESVDVTERRLWNGHINATRYDDEGARYFGVVLEQYKLCVEMADRVSARRALANTFFLTLNIVILTAIGVFWKDKPDGSVLSLLVPLPALVLQCFAWFSLIRSYRQLNGAKWIVVGALERRLPASPFFQAEWRALGEGRDRSKYWPLTHIEQGVPLLFAAVYVGGALLLLL